MPLWRECRFALRQLRKTPSFTVLVIATLGLCLGANTAVYSVLDAVLVRAVPFPQPDRLALVTTTERQGGSEYVQTSQTGGQFEIVRDHATRLDAAAYGLTSGVNFALGGRAALVRQQWVSSGFFRVFGTAPLLGREFLAAEDVPGGPRLAVLSYEFWQRVFEGRSSAIGSAIDLRVSLEGANDLCCGFPVSGPGVPTGPYLVLAEMGDPDEAQRRRDDGRHSTRHGRRRSTAANQQLSVDGRSAKACHSD